MKLIALLAASLIAGCATPVVTNQETMGVKYVQHVDDYATWPESCAPKTLDSGCHAEIDGVAHIWVSSGAAESTIAHERSHVAGMKHTAWSWDGRKNCAIITASGGTYVRGQRICLMAGGVESIE